MTKVLDHGVIDIIDHMGSDQSIERAARVSYGGDKQTRTTEETTKLLNYLMKHEHTSPFEHAVVSMYVKCPIFVARQWMRHRCLAGETDLWFSLPSGRIHKRSIKDIVDLWNHEDVQPVRPDKRTRSQREFNRDRIKQMRLRYRKDDGTLGHTKIVDAWCSGTRDIYRVSTNFGMIETTDDHPFLTEDGWKELKDIAIGECVYVSGRVREQEKVLEETVPDYPEVWVACPVDGYEVSNYGNVRSYRVKGSLARRDHPEPLKIIVNKAGRSVVNLGGKVYQVSHLVWNCFMGDLEHEQVIRHYNDNPQDNHLSNLIAGTHQDNTNDRIRNGGGLSGGFTLTTVLDIECVGHEPVYDITVDCEEHCFVANGFVVHNCWSYNEVSYRYKQAPCEFYQPEVWRGQSSDNKQMSDGTVDYKPVDDYGVDCAYLGNVHDVAHFEYQDRLDLGVSRELARTCLPLSTYTEFYATVDLHNLLHFVRLRLHPHAQEEIRVYAEVIAQWIADNFPITWAAFHKYRLKEGG